MNDHAVVEVERGVPEVWLQLRKPYIWTVSVLLILFLASSAVTVFAVVRLGAVQANQKASICRSKINADFFAGVADAFLAPPAPNPLRTTAVAEIKKAAAQLHNVTKTCGA